MRLAVTSPPATEPVLLAEAKAYVQVTAAADDILIDGLIETMCRRVEEEIGRSLITQTRTVTLDAHQVRPGLVLPRGPVQSITSFETYGADGSTTAASASAYYLAGDRVALSEDPGAPEWPTLDRYVDAALITYVAGYGDAPADVPAPIRQAIMYAVREAYYQRDRYVVGTSVTTLPDQARALLAPYRNMQIA